MAREVNIPRYLAWSGGADSTYMMIRCLEEGIPIDMIYTADTGMEFPEMYEYMKQVEEYVLRKYNVKIVRLTHVEGKGYMEFSREIGNIRGKLQVRGIPRQLEPCWLQRNAKIRPFEAWLKENNIGDHLIYIGYTADELKRAKMKVQKNNEAELEKINALEGDEKTEAMDKFLKKLINNDNKIISNNQLYPLILWGVDSDQVKLELQERGILNPLYKFFDRTGCFMCPKVGKDYYYKLWKHYPSEWKWMKKEEKKLRKLNAFNAQFNKDQTLKEMEREFESGEFSIEDYLRKTEEKDFCFCII